jgi:solute carrier family 25 phosphate transporter 23/24/25/41
MPETTINTSPLSPSAEITSTSLESSSSISQTPRTSTLDVRSVTTRSDIPETSPGHLPNNANNNQIAFTFFDRVKEFMSDNQLVINTFIAGGLAGATSRTVVSPLERLKIIL